MIGVQSTRNWCVTCDASRSWATHDRIRLRRRGSGFVGGPFRRNAKECLAFISCERGSPDEIVRQLDELDAAQLSQDTFCVFVSSVYDKNHVYCASMRPREGCTSGTKFEVADEIGEHLVEGAEANHGKAALVTAFDGHGSQELMNKAFAGTEEDFNLRGIRFFFGELTYEDVPHLKYFPYKQPSYKGQRVFGELCAKHSVRLCNFHVRQNNHQVNAQPFNSG